MERDQDYTWVAEVVVPLVVGLLMVAAVATIVALRACKAAPPASASGSKVAGAAADAPSGRPASAPAPAPLTFVSPPQPVDVEKAAPPAGEPPKRVTLPQSSSRTIYL